MLHGDNPQDYRWVMINAWQKYKKSAALEPLEQQIVAIIDAHPEYQAAFENPEDYLNKEFDPHKQEVNPFMHIAAHLSVLDMLALDNPTGIRTIYQQLSSRYTSKHEVEHRIANLSLLELQTALSEHREINMQNVLLQLQDELNKP